MTTVPKFTIPDIIGNPKYTTQEYVYRRLRNAIMIGAIEPGTSLTMRGLAEMMDLSPTPIREAIRRLSSEHAIEVMGNRRMTLPKISRGKFEELVALRVAVEVHAAERALPYISDIIIEKMVKIDTEMDELILAGNLEPLTLLNYEFHRVLYTANSEQAAMPVIESIWLQLGPFQRQVIKRISEYYMVDRHKEILAALRIRDATALGLAIKSDIRDGIIRSGRELLLQQSKAQASSN